MDDQPPSVDLATLVCVECWHLWLDPSQRWRAYLTDDEPPEMLLYCEHCAEREFGA